MKRKMFLMLVLMMAFTVVAVSAGEDHIPSAGERSAQTIDHFIDVRSLNTTRIPGLITTDFEPGDTFGLGPCAGQNGWIALNSPVAGDIDTVNPAGGVQHLRINLDGGLANGTFTGCVSPTTGTPSTKVEVDVAVSASGGADYSLGIFDTLGTGNLVGQATIYWTGGNVWVADGSGSIVDSGTPWVVGSYVTLGIELVGGNVVYSYGGVPIATYPSFGGSTTFDQVWLASDNWQAGETGDFDNLLSQAVAPTAVGLNNVGGIGTDTLLPILLLVAILGSLTIWVARKRTRQTEV